MDCQELIKKHYPEYKDVGFYLKQYLDKYITPATRLLDVGCGRQTYGEQYYRRAKEWVGVDPDAKALADNPSLIHQKISCTIKEIPQNLGQFDVITAQWVLEHVADPQADIRRISELCRSGGYFIFTTTNVWSPLVWLSMMAPTSFKKRRRRELLGIDEDDTHPTHYKINSYPKINRILSENGFVKDEIKTAGVYTYFYFNKHILLTKIYFDKLIDALEIFKPLNTHLVGVYKKR